MKFPEIPTNENERLNALKEYSILDTLPEDEYDDITALAAYICKTPISLISLIDDKRQWFKSHYGIEATETPKNIAFCAHAINDVNNILIVPDSRKDIRFQDNPLVTGAPHVIFYVGVPLVNDSGFPLGTLCVIDDKPRNLDESQLKALRRLSDQIIKLFELRKNQYELKILAIELDSQNHALNRFAEITAHDLRSPIGNIVMLTDLIESNYSERLDPKVKEFISHIGGSSSMLLNLIDGILRHSKNTHLLSANKENLRLNQIIHQVTKLVDINNEVTFELPKSEISLFANRVALEQILINLLSNAIKYNDKDEIKISIDTAETDQFVQISITDNGPGIKAEDRERIFQIFETSSLKDKEGKTGTGIGLATVKTLAEGLGGSINLDTQPEKGSTFVFTMKK